jgi:molecular chaperone GrpE (heat shock protein)
MRRIELLIGFILITGISLLIGAMLFDPKEGGKSLLFPAGLFATLTIVLVLVHFDTKGKVPAAKPAARMFGASSAAGLVGQDNTALLAGLARIEDRLTRLENVKPAVPHDPSQALQQLKEQQAKAHAELQLSFNELKNRPATAPAVAAAPSEDKLGELSGALSEAMKEISKRDGTIDTLAANVSRTNIQRILTRISQCLEVARSLQARVAEGKSTPAESFEFIVDDLNAALGDHGVESFDIAAGTRVSELAAGSFAAISVVDAPTEETRGTVKESRTRSYFVSEEGKKPRYIAPAKVILYRA